MLPRAIIFWVDEDLWISRIEDNFPSSEIKRLLKETQKGLDIKPNEIHLVEYECVEGEKLSLYRFLEPLYVIEMSHTVTQLANDGKLWMILRELEKQSHLFSQSETDSVKLYFD